MSEFSLESFSEKIHFSKTKYYFQEVLSSYHNGNYRSAVVMLWSIAICDIVYKLQNLIDIYEDTVAKSILVEISARQEENPKSALWESQLVKDTYDKTNLLDSSEYENLMYLQKQRHLSAHPTLKTNWELHIPNKETVRSLIRNTLEDLLIKPPFYTKQITKELLEDIAEASPALTSFEKVKKYISGRYLSRLKPEVELSIYRTLWKLVFRTSNDECDKNRYINIQVLEVIGKRHFVKILEKIASETDYFSNISSDPKILDNLVFYLSRNHDIYNLLNENAKIKVEYQASNTTSSSIFGWFLRRDLRKYYDDILHLIKTNNIRFTAKQLQFVSEISDTEEWQKRFCQLLSSYYCKSRNFNQADSRFQQAISPYLELFDSQTLVYLIEEIETNPQVYRRGGACEEHKAIKERILEVHKGQFDFSPYTNFTYSMIEDEGSSS